jgi:hypothetical protein
MNSSESPVSVQKVLQGADRTLLRFKKTLENENRHYKLQMMMIENPQSMPSVVRFFSVAVSLSLIFGAIWFIIM